MKKKLHRLMFLLLLLLCVIGSMIGCASTRVVLIPPGEITRAVDLRGTVSYYRNGEWVVSKNSVTIPEGYYILPPEPNEAD